MRYTVAVSSVLLFLTHLSLQDEACQKRVKAGPTDVCRSDCRDPSTKEPVQNKRQCYIHHHCYYDPPTKRCKTKTDRIRIPGKDKSDDKIKRHYGPDDHHIQQNLFPHIPISCNNNKFPYNCKPESYTSNAMECKVNIPYCMRIPCQVIDHRTDVESSVLACLSQPGCCYDEELSLHRRAYGQRFLPGVPVCHWAIRNQIFQKNAEKYAKQFNGWNPLLTGCLIENFKEQIFGDSEGCYMVTVIEYFGLRGKLAGWEGISPLECHLIGGCYRPKKGCVYPFDPSKGMRAELNKQEHSAVNKGIYSRHRCQPVKVSDDSYTFLDNYHQCLSSGCLLDPAAHTLYYNKMWNLTMSLNPFYQNTFWKSVMNFEIRPDNYMNEMERIKVFQDAHQFGPRFPFNIQHPVGGQQFPFSQGHPGLSHLGALPLARSGGRNSSSRFNNAKRNGAYNPHMPHPGIGIGSHIIPGFINPNLQCPYHNPQIQGLPPLKGRFTGCCEINLCYYPQDELTHDMYSHVTNYYTLWSTWSSCSATCDGGISRRTRSCVSPNYLNYKHDCSPQTVERPCNVHSCIPHWSNWSSFGPCSVTCGNGVKTRRRTCSSYGCHGLPSETVSCVTTCGVTASASASSWSTWGEYDACSTHCGQGQKTRNRVCTGHHCVGRATETISCVGTHCGSQSISTWAKWSEYNVCSVTCGQGVRTRKRLCTGHQCEGETSQTITCVLDSCPVDATIWTTWSHCSMSCGKGYKIRYQACRVTDTNCTTDVNKNQTQECVSFCGNVAWGKWSTCDSKCTMRRIATCSFGTSTGYCKYLPPPEVVYCKNSPCYCKTHPQSCIHRPVVNHHRNAVNPHPPRYINHFPNYMYQPRL